MSNEFYTLRVVSCTHHGWTPGAWVARDFDQEFGTSTIVEVNNPVLLSRASAEQEFDVLSKYRTSGTIFEIVQFVEV